MSAPCIVRRATAANLAAWGAMRDALWPDQDADRHPGEMQELLAREDWVAFLAFDAVGKAIGFAEASARRDYVNGTDSSPVGFLEGWYVVPKWQGHGVGTALVAAVEDWTRAHGLGELASDTWLHNLQGQKAHLACGFEETERVVYYRKRV